MATPPTDLFPRRATLVAMLACAVGYLYASPYYPGINNPNENVRVQMTAALVDFGTYRIDEIRARWGWSNDAACVERSASGALGPCETAAPAPGSVRNHYSVKAPLGSWLGVPAYALARAVRGDALTFEDAVLACRVGGSVLPVLALLFALRRYFEHDLAEAHLARETAFFALALGSVLLGYGVLFLSHTTSALVAFAAFARMARARERGRIGALDAAFAGLAASAVTALEYPAIFVTVTLCAMALVTVRPLPRLVAFGLGALVPVVLVMHFQASAFGSPFRPGHLFVENPAFRDIHHQGLFGADGFHLDAATRLLVDPRLGLLATTPFFLLAPLGALALRDDPRRRLPAAFALAAVLALYLPVTFLSNWDGGWVLGPRYLVTVFPFVAWLAAHGAKTLVAILPRGGAIPLGLLGASFVAGGMPSLYYPHLPPEIRAPIADLIGPLVRAGYAPRNLGLAAGLPMASSMVPLALGAAGLLVAIAVRSLGARRALAALAFALPIGFVAAAPSIAPQGFAPGVEQAQHFVMRTWHPPRP